MKWWVYDVVAIAGHAPSVRDEFTYRYKVNSSLTNAVKAPYPFRASHSARIAEAAGQAQPSSFIAHPAFQILVMCQILSPAKSIT